MVRKRVSKRRYPARNCKQCRQAFTPTDRRQVYCCSQCRVDFNNDKRSEQEAPLLAFKKKLAHNEKCLIKAKKTLEKNNRDYISLDFLLYDGFEIDVYSERGVNQTTGNTVLWSLQHGLEGVDKNRNLYKIIKK